MPKVGKQHFPYSKEGKEAAKRYAAKTGQQVEYAEDSKELAPKYSPKPTNKERREMVKRAEWEGEQEYKSIPDDKKMKSRPKKMAHGGQVGGSRRHHRGCGAVMDDRRKKTLYVGE